MKPSALASKAWQAPVGGVHDGGRQHQVHPAGQREVGIADAQALARHVQRDNGGRAGGVDGDRRAAQVQEVRQPIGDDAQRATGVAPGVDIGHVQSCDVAVVGIAGSGEHAGLRAAQRTRWNSRVFQRLPSNFEQHALLRVHLDSFTAGDLEEVRVEFVDVVHVSAEAGGAGQRRSGLG
jgi:hypothetical protein